MSISNLSNGLIGSVLGALVTFLAAAFTLWRTRVGDRRRGAAREAEREQDRRDALVGQLVGSLRMIEAEVRWAPLLRGRTMRHFLELTMTFYASQRPSHPEVAAWLLAQSTPYQAKLRRWQRVCLVPGLNKRRLREFGELTGELYGAIVGWVSGDISDTHFADPKRTPIEVAKAAGLGRPHAEPARRGHLAWSLAKRPNNRAASQISELRY